MVRHFEKEEIANRVLKDGAGYGSKGEIGPGVPILAFDNEKQKNDCPNCDAEAIMFKRNVAEASGSETAIFDWNPDLEQFFVRGTVCPICDYHEVYVDGELVKEGDGAI